MKAMHVHNNVHLRYWILLSLGCHGKLEAEPQNIHISHSRFKTYDVDLTSQSIEILPFPHNLDALLSTPDSKTWTMIMNAGMFEPDHSPVGLQIVNGQELHPLNQQEGTGNFYLKPNGVFAITTTSQAIIVNGLDVPSDRSTWKFATQSGPLLLDNGILHPRLNPSSTHKHIRNGVCIQSPEAVVFVISTVPVQFYELAMYMKEDLHCTDGLYLDGAVSVLYEKTSEGSWTPQPLSTTLGSWLIVQLKSSTQ